jgi:hypothetical protein
VGSKPTHRTGPFGLRYRSVVQSKCVCASALIAGGSLVDETTPETLAISLIKLLEP